MRPLTKTLTLLFGLGLLAAAAYLLLPEAAPDGGGAPPVQVPQAIGTTEDPHARARYEWLRLRDPATGEIPAHVRRRELAFAAALPARTDLASKTGAAVLEWTARGPVNLGGRTRALGIDRTDPDVLLAGGVSGGMWRSDDGGASWVETTTPDQHRSVSALLQDPRLGQADTWYFGSGEPLVGNSPSAPGGPYLGSGLYRSTDEGRSWERVGFENAGNDPGFNVTYDVIYNLAMDPTNLAAPELYVATYGLIYRTFDDGQTRELVLLDDPENPSFSQWTDVAVDRNGVVYAALSSDGGRAGLWRSPDGDEWTDITPDGWPAVFGRTVIGIAPSDPNVVYFLAETEGFGADGHSLWRYTHDPGTGTGTWENRSDNLPTDDQFSTDQDVGGFDAQGGYNLVVAVKPGDADVVFVGGTNLYRSTDGFASTESTAWVGGYHRTRFIYPNHHPDQHAVVFYPDDADRMLTGDDGGIHRTEDNMSNWLPDTPVRWESLNNGYRTTQFYSVALDEEVAGSNLIIGGMQDNGTFFTNNVDGTFPWLGDVLGGDGAFADVADADSFVYVSAQNAQIYRLTIDREASNVNDAILGFARVDPPEADFGDALFITPFMLDPANEERMFLGGGDRIWRNDDLTAIRSGNTSSTLAHWKRLENTGGDGLTITAIRPVAVPAGDSITTRLYYATSGDAAADVWRLDRAWDEEPVPVEITGADFPDGYVSCIAVNPANVDEVMVVFTNYGIESLFHSTDAGATWTAVGGNLEADAGIGTPPSTRWAEILPTAGGTNYFVATSVGVWSTSRLDGEATTWAQEGADVIGAVVVDMIDARPVDGFVVVGTHGTGVYSAFASAPVAAEPAPEAPPPDFRLSAPYPNPFNPETHVTLTVDRPQRVRVDVYDAVGRRVAALHDGRLAPGAAHRFTFAADALPSGTYFIRAAGADVHVTRQVVLVK